MIEPMNTPYHLLAEALPPRANESPTSHPSHKLKAALLAALLLVVACLSGCATAESAAYRTLGATAYVVDGAMNGWGDWVRAGRATPAQEASVKAAYERYQAAMRVARAAVTAYKTAPDRPALDRALDAVDAARVALIGLLHVFHPQPATP